MKKIKEVFINRILKKKRILIPLIIIVGVGLFFILRPSNNSKNTDKFKRNLDIYFTEKYQ